MPAGRAPAGHAKPSTTGALPHVLAPANPRPPSAPNSSDESLLDLYGDYFETQGPHEDVTSEAQPQTHTPDVAQKNTMDAFFWPSAPRAQPRTPQQPPVRNSNLTCVLPSFVTDDVLMRNLSDPLYLVPQRPAPRPPLGQGTVSAFRFRALQPPAAPDFMALPVIMITPPTDDVLRMGVVLANEVHHLLLVLAKENARINRCTADCLVRHLRASKSIGYAIAVALQRLYRLAEEKKSHADLAACFPAVQGILAQHMLAVIAASGVLPPPSLVVAAHDARRARHTKGLHLLVGPVSFDLPLAVDVFAKMEQDCEDAKTIKALGTFYRALRELAGRLPPGGDPRMCINLPHKYYTPYPTPGQMAAEWGRRSNVLFARYHQMMGTSGASETSTADRPTERLSWHSNLPGV